MTTYLVQVNLNQLRERLSRCLRCPCSLADVRDLLANTGFVESSLGWLTHDVRPLMIAFLRPNGRLV